MTPRNATELAKVAMMKPPATDQLSQAQNAKHFAELLIEKDYWMPAVNYMSHAIPAREGIFWAWKCSCRAMNGDADEDIQKALKLAEKWIAQPNEENRLAAKDFAERIPSGSPAQCVLEAISFVGEMEDPITGNKAPMVPYISSKFVAAAVVGASYIPDPKKPQTAAVEYLQESMIVADKIQLWSQFTESK